MTILLRYKANFNIANSEGKNVFEVGFNVGIDISGYFEKEALR